jgi:cytochrome c oxidase assembly protein subunit 15
MRRGETLLTVLLIQGAVGYVQYFSGVPAWLVAIHVTLAAVLWAVTVQFTLGLTTRVPASAPTTAGSTATAAAGTTPAGTDPDPLLAPA